MSEFKYVVIKYDGKDEYQSREFPFIFPHQVPHKDFADAMIRMFDWHSREPGAYTVVAAGFVSGTEELGCWGESESLKIKSRMGVDTELVKHYPYLHGIVP